MLGWAHDDAAHIRLIRAATNAIDEAVVRVTGLVVVRVGRAEPETHRLEKPERTARFIHGALDAVDADPVGIARAMRAGSTAQRAGRFQTAQTISRCLISRTGSRSF